ncbi:MAG: hypothetical protein H0X51_02915 [Parachlamydiaceae bacterium]|nr:hypothetical protein [Parachlamydiaceae bacterium]
MLVEKDIKRLFQQLVQDDTVHIAVDGVDVLVRVFDHASKLFLSATVYTGGNFIPQSVRKTVGLHAPFMRDEQIKTYITVDDNHYLININYIGKMDCYSDSLRQLLEEFSWLAEQWRSYLDERGKQDLIHIHVK